MRPQPITEAPTSTARLARENEMINQSIADFETEDISDDLSDLKRKYCEDRKFDFVICCDSGYDHLLLVKISCADVPKVMCSIKIFSDLSFTAYDEVGIIKSAVYKDCMQFYKKIVRYSDF